jgi:hypothetical protein
MPDEQRSDRETEEKQTEVLSPPPVASAVVAGIRLDLGGFRTIWTQ